MLKEYSTIWQLKLDENQDEIQSDTPEEPPADVPACAEMRLISKIMAKINEGARQETFERIELSRDTVFSPEATEEIKNLFKIEYFKRFQKIVKIDKFGVRHHIKANRVIIFFHRPKFIFVLTTGCVAKELKDHCDPDFPMKIASRLLDPDTIVKNERIQFVGDIRNRIHKMRNKGPIDTRDITGLLTSLTAELKKNASIYKFDFLRGLPKSTTTRSNSINEIPTTTTTTIIPTPLKYDIKFKNIKLNKTLSVDQDVQLLDHYSKIVNGEKTYKFELAENSVPSEENEENFQKGVKMVDVDLQNKLDSELYLKLYGKIKDPNYPFNFEICHDVDEKKKFATASNYKIIYNRRSYKHEWQSRPSSSDFLTFIKKWNFFDFNLPGAESNEQIRNKMSSIKLSYFYDNKRYYDKIIDFIECVIFYENENYWRLNQQWLQVSSDCIVDIHIRFLKLLKEKDFLIPIKHLDHLTEKWKEIKKFDEKKNKEIICKESENAYNQKFHDEKYPNFIVGDKFLVNTIEFFDILKIGNPECDTSINIYHVKIGFGQKARDVCSQLRNSAKIIHGAVAQTSKVDSILGKLYKNLLSKSEENKDNVLKKLVALNINNVTDFLKKFKEHRNLTFIYATLLNRKEGSLKDEKDTKYNITKNDIKEYLTSRIDIFKDDILLSNNPAFPNEFNLDVLTDKIYDDLTRVKKYFNDDGDITVRLLYKYSPKGEGEPEPAPVDAKSRLIYEKLLKDLIVPYQSKFSSLIAKIEIVETKKTISEYGFIFKIDEIENEFNESSQIQSSENIPTNTPESESGPSKSSSSSNRKKNSVKKRPNNSPPLPAETCETFEIIPKRLKLSASPERVAIDLIENEHGESSQIQSSEENPTNTPVQESRKSSTSTSSNRKKNSVKKTPKNSPAKYQNIKTTPKRTKSSKSTKKTTKTAIPQVKCENFETNPKRPKLSTSPEQVAHRSSAIVQNYSEINENGQNENSEVAEVKPKIEH